jgi:hypothetical protein
LDQASVAKYLSEKEKLAPSLQSARKEQAIDTGKKEEAKPGNMDEILDAAFKDKEIQEAFTR